MTSANQPPAFAFDFTRADRVNWSYAGRKQGLQGQPMTAEFFVDDRKVADQLASVLPPLMADAVDIASAAHTADCLAPRTVIQSSNWSRNLELSVCVRCPEQWSDPVTKERLERLLAFLTEDVWHLAFVPRRDSRRSSELQNHFAFAGSSGNGAEVSLFSGGLDSLAGTAGRASECPTRLILVSASPNPQQRSRQQSQVKVLREEFGAPISHVCVPYGIHRGDEYTQEPSRRTRGLLFLIFGGVTALLAESSALYLYENGIGAMNLPYDQSQIGADNTRACHPRVLREVGELLSLVGGKRFSIHNRCIYSTKAEMLRHSWIDRVRGAIPFTFSCDGFPVRAKGRPQCGFCTSCLLRRYSLELAGLGEVDLNGYLQDLRSPSFRPTRHQLRGLQAMDWQVLGLERCLADRDPWHAATIRFPGLRVLANDLSLNEQGAPARVEAKLLRVLRQHVADWPSFSALRLLNASTRTLA